MAEQLSLFEDLLPLDKKRENINLQKTEIKSQRDKKEEKAFYIHNHVTQELDNVNDPNYIERVNKEVASENLSSITPSRDETHIERQSRYSWLYGDGSKPKHYDNNSIKKVDTFKGFAKAMPVVKENGIYKKQIPTPVKPFNNFDKSTYPSNPKVKANLNAWELMKATAKTPKEKADIKRILFADYKKGNARHMSEEDLKLIKKGKYIEYPKIEIPKVEPTPIIREPSIPIEVRIKQMADKRLEREQKEYDNRYGTNGIVILRRPN